MPNQILKNLQYLNQFLAQERVKQEQDEKKEKLNKAIQTAAETFEGTESIGEVTSAYNESIKAAAQSGAPKALNTINVLYQNAINEIQYNKKQEEEKKIAGMLKKAGISIPENVRPSTYMQTKTALKQLGQSQIIKKMSDGGSMGIYEVPYDIRENKFDYENPEFIGKTTLTTDERIRIMKEKGKVFNTSDDGSKTGLNALSDMYSQFTLFNKRLKLNRNKTRERLKQKAEEFNDKLVSIEYGGYWNLLFGGSPDLRTQVNEMRDKGKDELTITRDIIANNKEELKSLDKRGMPTLGKLKNEYQEKKAELDTQDETIIYLEKLLHKRIKEFPLSQESSSDLWDRFSSEDKEFIKDRFPDIGSDSTGTTQGSDLISPRAKEKIQNIINKQLNPK